MINMHLMTEMRTKTGWMLSLFGTPFPYTKNWKIFTLIEDLGNYCEWQKY